MKAYIGQVEKGFGEVKIFGRVLFNDKIDILRLHKKLGLFRDILDYMGKYEITQPHDFVEGQLVEVEIEKGKIISVKKLEESTEKAEDRVFPKSEGEATSGGSASESGSSDKKV
jgi:hypothetical protein